MILVNHFLDYSFFGILIPNQTAAGTTNGAASITAQADLCSGLYGRTPNFILVGLYRPGWISGNVALIAPAFSSTGSAWEMPCPPKPVSMAWLEFDSNTVWHRLGVSRHRLVSQGLHTSFNCPGGFVPKYPSNGPYGSGLSHTISMMYRPPFTAST